MPDLSVASIAVRVSRYLPAKRVRVRSWKQRLFSRPWRPWVPWEWYEDHHTGLYGGTLGSVARRLTERGLEQAMRDWKDLPA